MEGCVCSGRAVHLQCERCHRLIFDPTPAMQKFGWTPRRASDVQVTCASMLTAARHARKAKAAHRSYRLGDGNEKTSGNQILDGEPFIDNHQGQLDRSASRRLRDACWR